MSWRGEEGGIAAVRQIHDLIMTPWSHVYLDKSQRQNEDSVTYGGFTTAGTSWPGVFFAEDQKALDVLCARKDVDANRVGCGGLSGGGMRTVFIGGLDPRIK